MKKHAEYAKQIINSTTEGALGDGFRAIASEIAATHHERWDGLGYA